MDEFGDVRGDSWRRRTLVAAALLALSALAASACGGGDGDPFAPRSAEPGPGAGVTAPSGSELADAILRDALDLELGNEPEPGGDGPRALEVEVETIGGVTGRTLAASGSVIWMTDTENGVIRSVDTATGVVGDDIEVGADPIGIAVDGDEVWVANSGSFDHTVMRIDGASGEIELTVETEAGTSPTGVALTADHVWVGIGSRGVVAQIDRRTGELLTVVSEDPAQTGGGGSLVDVLATDTAVWAIDRWCGRVIRIDPSTARITSIHDDLGYVAENAEDCTGLVHSTGPSRLAAFEGGVFVLASVLDDAGARAGRIYRIDEATDTVAPLIDLAFVPPAEGGRHGLPGLLVEEGGIWFSGGDRSVRMNRAGGRIDGVFAAENVVALIEIDGVVWHSVIDPFFDGENSGLYGVDAAEAAVAAS